MRFNVAQQLKEPSGSVRHYQIHELTEALDEDARVPHLVTGDLSLLRTDRGILALGTLRTAVGAICSRCLEPFEQDLTLEIQEEYLPLVDIASGLALRPPRADEVFTVDEYHMLDLTEAMRQAGVLAGPMKPVCVPDCLGLCLGCGRNLNLGPCACAPVPSDPRWAVLEGFGQPRGDQPEKPERS